jgi:hypothetical protein
MARRVFKVPDTRLPFINGEITQVEFQGKPHVVSGVWAGTLAGARIYFWDPVGKTQAMRALPKESPGVYMLKTGPDGRLYLGDGKGDLYRYDPKTDAIELLVGGKLKSITQSGCVTDRYVVWSTEGGDAGVFHWKEDKFIRAFDPIDTSEPQAHYGHYLTEAPDGKVLLPMGTPQARLCLLDLSKMEMTSHTPDALVGEAGIWGACFFDDHTLLILSTNKVQVLSYPDFKRVRDIGYPDGCSEADSKGTRLGNAWYAILTKGGRRMLYRLIAGEWKWELIDAEFQGEETGYLGTFQDRYLCAVTVSGIASTLDTQTQKTTSLQLDNFGPMAVQSYAVGAEMNVIVGSPFINARCWTIDMNTGKGEDRGRGMPGGGQINQTLWDAGRHRALMCSYTSAAVSEFDPLAPGEWPKNPRLIASAREKYQQMRPNDAVFDRRAVWMATAAEYGVLGGALVRVDPETSKMTVMRNIVPDQTVNALALDLKRRRLYFSTEIFADQKSAPPTQTTAEIGVVDIDTLKLIKRQPFKDGVPKCGVICPLPDGRVLLHRTTDYYAWDADRGEIASLGVIDLPLSARAVDQDGTVYLCLGGKVGRIDVDEKGMHFTPKIEAKATRMQIVEGKLYFSTGAEIHEVPMEELRG